jgi:hypothetical protein
MDPPLNAPDEMMEIMEVGTEDDEQDVCLSGAERAGQGVKEVFQGVENQNVDWGEEDVDWGEEDEIDQDGDEDKFETPPPALTIGDVLDRLPKKKVGKIYFESKSKVINLVNFSEYAKY